jgi:hypothetical protein
MQYPLIYAEMSLTKMMHNVQSNSQDDCPLTCYF